MLILPEKAEHYKTKNLFSYIKMDEEVLCLAILKLRKMNL